MLIHRRVAPDQWQPIGIDALEPNALEVVRSTNNRSVIAGPGSGKTELLAQRAAYLLQTGVTRTPRRILAISFKRDAARNLGARVRSRCHPEQAYRFDSLTFDAFAKGLVDRFGQALPERWRPTSDYEIANAGDQIYQEFLQSRNFFLFRERLGYLAGTLPSSRRRSPMRVREAPPSPWHSGGVLVCRPAI
jgi:superfamily I DNA/RNA helicase